MEFYKTKLFNAHGIGNICNVLPSRDFGKQSLRLLSRFMEYPWRAISIFALLPSLLAYYTTKHPSIKHRFNTTDNVTKCKASQ